MHGLVCRELKLRDRHTLELLGPGDVLQPVAPQPEPVLATGPRTTILARASVLALGATYIEAAAQWPSLLHQVMVRVTAAHDRLAVQQLIVHLPLAEHRLLLVLWHLGTRWGQVTSSGLHVPLRLTHDVLGQLTAARRSTVTLAVREVIDAGYVERTEDGTWIVTEAGVAAVRAVAHTDRSRSLGETLLLRQRTRELIQDSRALRANAPLARVHRDGHG